MFSWPFIWSLEMTWLDDDELTATGVVQSSMTGAEWSVAYKNLCRTERKNTLQNEEKSMLSHSCLTEGFLILLIERN